MATYEVFEHMTNYTFSNSDYTLSVQVPSHDGELTAMLYDFKFGAEPVSLSLTYDQVIGLIRSTMIQWQSAMP